MRCRQYLPAVRTLKENGKSKPKKLHLVDILYARVQNRLFPPVWRPIWRHKRPSDGESDKHPSVCCEKSWRPVTLYLVSKTRKCRPVSKCEIPFRRTLLDRQRAR